MPTRWLFHASSINPNGRLVVFASGNNRTVAGSHLPTNSSLSASGETIAMIKPDAVTVVSRFDFGPQNQDVSYGVTALATTEENLVAANAPEDTLGVTPQPVPRGTPPPASFPNPWTLTAMACSHCLNTPAAAGKPSYTCAGRFSPEGKFVLRQMIRQSPTRTLPHPTFPFHLGRLLASLRPNTPFTMQKSLKIKLSIFMFLQYFIWGSWYVSMGSYLANTLKFEGAQIGLAYGAFAIGAMISPFLVGLIADRYFASEKILAVLGIFGGAVLCLLPRFQDFDSFYPVLILYCALYVPTLALGNSLSMHHLENPKTDFPRVKMLSAVGWIAGLATLNALDGAESPIQFYLAGGASIVFGLFSLMMPHTPPMKTGANVSIGEILGFDALALLKKPSFAIFIVCMFLICIPLYFYFVNLGIYLTELKWENMLLKTSFAQLSDVVFFLLLPLFLRRLGYKTTIFVGIACWVLRYFALSSSVGAGASQTALIFTAILLHGACYDFLFIAGQLYVDDEANERIRGAAQGFIAFILWGVGAFVGTLLAGKVLAAHKLAAPVNGLSHDWKAIWLAPAWGAAAVLVLFLIFFRNPTKAAS